MDTLRLSVTELDSFRHWENDEPWMTTEKLIEQLSGRGEATDKMRAGSAFHAQLESLQDHEYLDSFSRDGFDFDIQLNGELFLPQILEVKTEMKFRFDDLEVTLVGKADAIYGKKIWDHKLSEQFDAEKYADSLQWRAYLLMFDADSFTYNVFTWKDKKGVIAVNELHQFTVYRYEGIEKDVRDAVRLTSLFIKGSVPQRLNDAEQDAKALQW